MKRTLSLIALAATLAGCSTEIVPAQRSPEDALKLQQALAGRVAGPALKCLPPYRQSNMVTIDDNTILFRRGGTYYRSDLPGGCTGLGSGHYALVTRSPSGGLCEGDIATVADLRTGMSVGSCTLGAFVPYRK